MRRAAAMTQGGAEPSTDTLFDPRGQSIRAYEEIWSKLLLLALALFLLDLLLRRVRIFDRAFARPGR